MIENEYFKFQTGQATDTGKVRDHNEDSHLARPDFGLWLVADGMGGHDAGDFASQTIAAEAASVGMSSSLQDLQARFMERLGRAHSLIQTHAAELGGGTVGATLVTLLIHEDEYACIWSGDSRIYLLRNGQLVQQTRDHTEVQQLLDTGAISATEAETWPRKNVITRAIGVSDAPQCDVVTGTLEAGDTFVLCSDGLTEHLSDGDIAQFTGNGSEAGAQMICNEMIRETLSRGAKDNVTTVVIRCFAREELV
ncbi:protein phosphatase 2C domain-containing protein [uncultured Litoreibacter sp.]|uniref:PP2C family protein-serine/threonine phosphatase n=1 Tax=uncultured Litoreibacter sp. TaxID=1392394 RepID=UPI00260E9CBE|nr:protein phosphatase 2C domain-containing protein [uncultured Litoreibacter sp.]